MAVSQTTAPLTIDQSELVDAKILAAPDQLTPGDEKQDSMPLESKDDLAKTAECSTYPNDFWRGSRGSFRLQGRSGRGIYEYGGVNYNTAWSFEDCCRVGGRPGWTFREDGYVFYMFFGSSAHNNGKYEMRYSVDNTNFRGYIRVSQ